MTTPLKPHDLEQLNAYLDGELPPDERVAIESRLNDDPTIQAELDSLRETTALIGMSERLHVPRNFTLDPAIYAKLRRVGLLDWLGATLRENLALPVGAAAALAVIVVGGAMSFSGVGGGNGLSGNVAFAPEAALESEIVAPAEEVILEDSNAQRDGDLDNTESAAAPKASPLMTQTSETDITEGELAEAAGDTIVDDQAQTIPSTEETEIAEQSQPAVSMDSQVENFSDSAEETNLNEETSNLPTSPRTGLILIEIGVIGLLLVVVRLTILRSQVSI